MDRAVLILMTPIAVLIPMVVGYAIYTYNPTLIITAWEYGVVAMAGAIKLIVGFLLLLFVLSIICSYIQSYVESKKQKSE